MAMDTNFMANYLPSIISLLKTNNSQPAYLKAGSSSPPQTNGPSFADRFSGEPDPSQQAPMQNPGLPLGPNNSFQDRLYGYGNGPAGRIEDRRGPIPKFYPGSN